MENQLEPETVETDEKAEESWVINPAWANTLANPITPTIDRHPPPDEAQRYLVIGGTVGDDDGAGVGTGVDAREQEKENESGERCC